MQRCRAGTSRRCGSDGAASKSLCSSEVSRLSDAKSSARYLKPSLADTVGSKYFISGHVPSMSKIAAHEGVTKRYVSRLIRLSLLAPVIVDGIAKGTQAPALTAQALLTRTTELPFSWHAQQDQFGLAVPS